MIKKKLKKENREHEILFSLIEFYIKTGKPVGSQTLKKEESSHLSSSTIRNYFAELEKKGFLSQQHASGGRAPTLKAYKLYAEESLQYPKVDPQLEEKLIPLGDLETKGLSAYLQNAADVFSELIEYPVFLSSVRFDHDLIIDIKLVMIDQKRILCILITDFGQILSEVLTNEKKIGSFALKRIEQYFLTRLRNKQETEETPTLSSEELFLARNWYNEIMVRYLVRYSNFSDVDLIKTGFSKLLAYPEFNDPIALVSALSLFEDSTHMRHLLRECSQGTQIRFWIGEELSPYTKEQISPAIITIPYRIHQMTTGAIGVLGPCRISYPDVFGSLQLFAATLSSTLTKSLYKYKLTFRQPHKGTPYLEQEEKDLALLSSTPTQSLIEKKRVSYE